MATPKEIGLRIEQSRKEAGLTLSDIADAIGVARSTVQRYEKGEINKIKLPVIEAIANVLKVNPSWLIYKTDDRSPVIVPLNPSKPYKPNHTIPILGRVSAGLPLYAEEHIEGYTATDLNGGAEYFALRVQGDSMNALRISDGDILIVRRQDFADNGDIAVVLINDEDATVKRFYQEGSTVILYPQSTNPVHQPQRYDLASTRVRILGKVVRNQIDF